MEFISNPENDIEGQETAQSLMAVLDKYKDKRVLVVGVPCSGKSTLLKFIPGALDMDDVIIPRLSDQERIIAFQSRLNFNSGKYEQIPHNDSDPERIKSFDLASHVLQTLTKERYEVVPGRPMFATLVIPSDIIVYLKIDDELLRERISSRAKKNNRPQQYIFVKRVEMILERQILEAEKKGVVIEEFPISKGINDK